MLFFNARQKTRTTQSSEAQRANVEAVRNAHRLTDYRARRAQHEARPQ